MAFGVPRGRPTPPPQRAGYRRDQTGQKWAGIEDYTEWSWVPLKSNVNKSFREGEKVCLLDVQSGRISPTPRENQANTWEKQPADTEYRVAKWVTRTKTALFPCEDAKGSINHMSLSQTKGGKPLAGQTYSENTIVYLLPHNGPFAVRYPDPKTGAKYTIEPNTCGKILARTSYNSGVRGVHNIRGDDPERAFYIVGFPIEYEEAKWVICNIAVNTQYLGTVLPPSEQDRLNRALTAPLAAPKVVKLKPSDVQMLSARRV